MPDITLGNGGKLVMRPAGFMDVMALKNATEQALLDANIDLSKVDFEKIMAADVASGEVMHLMKGVIHLDASEKFNKAMMKCLGVCTYDFNGVSERISEGLFDVSPEIREFYYQMVIEGLKINLGPFIKGLNSGWRSLAQQVQTLVEKTAPKSA